MKAARLSWFEGQLDLDPDRPVFLDEVATNTKMVRRYGRAPRGERCRVAVPFGHWKTITVTAGLRANGLMATALFDGPMTGARFRGYVEETLVPALKRSDTVVLDNLPAHKVGGIRERIEAAGARRQGVPPEGDDDRLVLQAEHAGAGLLRSHPRIRAGLARAPLLHRRGADALALGSGPYALLTSLDCPTDHRSRRGAAVENLSHSPSLPCGISRTTTQRDQTSSNDTDALACDPRREGVSTAAKWDRWGEVRLMSS